MRFAILHYSHPPVIGGVERVIGEQAAALRSLGHDVALFERTAASRARFRTWLDLRAVRPPSSAAKQGLRAPGQSIVIVHNVFTMPFDLSWTKELIALSRARPAIRWINWIHDVRWAEEAPRAIHIAVSEHRKAEYARHTRDAIHILPNGLDASALLGLTDRVAALRLQHAGLVLLHPARFVRRKNIELGLRLLAELPDDALYLVTAAPDPHQPDGLKYFRELRRLAKDLGIAKRVRFLGDKTVLTDADVRSLYQMADALIFPSTQEGYGLPLLEAALHGVPVFCSDIPAHREVAAPDACFFKLTTSPRAIARKIRAHPAVRSRQERRALIARLDWADLLSQRLLPLLDHLPESGLRQIPPQAARAGSKSRAL